MKLHINFLGLVGAAFGMLMTAVTFIVLAFIFPILIITSGSQQ